MKKCPKCGCTSFYTNAHIIQGWLVNKDGDFIAVTEECVETTHGPDDNDIWACSKCGYEATGKEMEMNSHDVMVCELSRQKTINIADDSFIEKIILDENDVVVKSLDQIKFYVPVMFDPDKAFALDVATDQNDDHIYAYVNWSPLSGISMFITYCASAPDMNDFTLGVVLNEQQKKRLYYRLRAECLEKYSIELNELYNELVKE